MQYTIKQLANLANISTRTLRYYDEINLLKPSYINDSGYRIYTEKEVDMLQQILFYKSMDIKLEDIQKIISNENFDINNALKEHLQNLILKRDEINRLILTVQKTISYNKGEINMSNKEKFEGFKKEKLAENEAKYGKEIREKYGEETVEESNKKFLNLTEEEFAKMNQTEEEMLEALEKLIETQDFDSDEAKTVYEKHRQWLSYSWKSYSPKAHVGLAQMYINDERFAKYYNDKKGEKATQTLTDAIIKYAK